MPLSKRHPKGTREGGRFAAASTAAQAPSRKELRLERKKQNEDAKIKVAQELIAVIEECFEKAEQDKEAGLMALMDYTDEFDKERPRMAHNKEITAKFNELAERLGTIWTREDIREARIRRKAHNQK